MKKTKQDSKIVRRRRKVALRRFWYYFRIFLLLLFLGAAIYGLNFFYNSDYFKIKEIDIEGLESYSRQEIMSYLDKYIGQNIFEIERKDIEFVLLSNLPRLKQAELKKIFPDRISVTAVERKPYIMGSHGSQYFLLDREGVVIEVLNKDQAGEIDNLLLVGNALDYKPELGETVAKKNALSCGKIYTNMDNELKRFFKQAKLEESGEIIFITQANKQVIFGDSENIPQKISVLKELLKDDIKYNIIDLSNFNIPIVK